MNISPISLAFEKSKKEKRPALLTYTVAGDNSKKKSLEILNSISNYADICEVGFPHNTPIADGGQIQTSAYRAIKNGIKMKDTFQIIKNFKNIFHFNAIFNCSIRSRLNLPTISYRSVVRKAYFANVCII